MTNLTGKKVLVSEPLPQAYEVAERMKMLGAEVDFGPAITLRDDKRTLGEMKKIVKEYDGFIGMSREKFPREVLEQADRLSVIGKYGIGVDHIDIEAATENDVLVTISPANRITVAEHTITLMLTLFKNIRKSQRYLNESNWRAQELVGRELYGKTIGFLGVGGISREVAARLSGWGCRFIGYDPYVGKEALEQIHVTKAGWDELFQTADIISMHLPLTEETREAVGAKEFAMMKRSAVLINTARGKLIDQAALIDAVKSEAISGCALDVMKNEEPIPKDDPIMELAGRDNVLLTPHTAGWCIECQRRYAEITTENVILALEGKEPGYVVNKAVLQRRKAEKH